MRQVEKECNELDWSQNGGETVGGGIATITDDLNGRHTAGATGVRLGGGSGTSRLLQMNTELRNEGEQHEDVVMEELREEEKRDVQREDVKTKAKDQPDESMRAPTELRDDEVPTLASSEPNKAVETNSIATAPSPLVSTSC